MSVPTAAELETALKEAAWMRENGEDPYHIAKVLLNLNYRVELLEKVHHAAKHYLHSGLAAHEHTELERAIAKAGKAAERLGSEHETLGLSARE